MERHYTKDDRMHEDTDPGKRTECRKRDHWTTCATEIPHKCVPRQKMYVEAFGPH